VQLRFLVDVVNMAERLCAYRANAPTVVAKECRCRVGGLVARMTSAIRSSHDAPSAAR
jgi:hypothetical protein